jgi:hypothetical protein
MGTKGFDRPATDQAGRTPPRPQLGDHVTLYTLAEAARILRVSVHTLRRMEAAGDTDLFTWIAKRIFMTGDQICRLIANGQTTPAPVARPARRARAPKPRRAA